MPNYYNTGTVSVNNGATTVTLSGGLWSSVLAGDTLELAGQRVTIASVTDTTHLVLATAWSGTTQSGAAYLVRFDAPSRFTSGYLAEQVRALVAKAGILEATAPLYQVQTIGANSPPGSPVSGDMYVVGTVPTGAWAGRANNLAQWTGSGGWLFISPSSGWMAFNADNSTLYQYTGSSWVNAVIDAVKFGSPQSLTTSQRRQALDNIGLDKYIVIVCTGQSNCDIFRAYSWAPAENVEVWNWRGIYNVPAQDDDDVGTGFIPLEDDIISWGRSLANEVGLANPDKKVLLINVGWSGMAISHWMTGTSAPDVYNAVKINVEAALSDKGLSAGDYKMMLAIWQGESDALTANTSWANNLETVIARFRGETWFPRSSQIILSGFSPYDAPAGVASEIQFFEDQLRLAASRDAELRTYASYANTANTLWESTESYRHATAEGYRQTGIIAFNSLASGANSGINAVSAMTITKRRQTSRTSNTTVSADADLYVTLRAGKDYVVNIDALLFSVAGGAKWSVVGPSIGVVTSLYKGTVVAVGGSASEGNLNAQIGFPTNVALAGAGIIRISCELVILAVAADGVLSFNWAQNTSNVNATTMNPGSRIRIQEI